MVRGLAKFREQFRSHAGQYVLIGGAACDLLMEEAGDAIDAKSIAKHKNDVFRLYRVLDPAIKTGIPKEIRDDMRAFLDAMVSEQVDLKNLEIKGQSLGSILGELRRIYVGD